MLNKKAKLEKILKNVIKQILKDLEYNKMFMPEGNNVEDYINDKVINIMYYIKAI